MSTLFNHLRLMLVLCAAAISSQAYGRAPAGGGDLSCAFFSPNPDDSSGPPINFYADLSADEESAVTESPGVGRVDLTLERSTLKISWKVTYSNLTSPEVGVHIHGPQTPGGEAGIIVDMAPQGIKNPTQGSAALTDGDMIYLVQDRLYVNLHTTKYPAGELRGQLKRARPKCG